MIGRWILGLLLLAMALGQALDPAGHLDIMETYRLGHDGISAVVAVALFAAEVVGGTLLLLRRRPGEAVALVAAVGWTVVGVQAFARGLELPNCGCFGVYLSQPLRWWVLVQNAEFVALAAWVLHRSRAEPDQREARTESSAASRT